MSDMVQYYWDRCGGNIQNVKFNELWNASEGDIGSGAWSSLITPPSGGRLVIFSVLLRFKDSSLAGAISLRLGQADYIGDFYQLHDTASTIGNFLHVPGIPIIGAVDTTFQGYCYATDALEPGLFLQYGIIAAAQA